MSGRDLGTYYVRVELADGRGWIDTWNTGARFTDGTPDHSPLTATRISCIYATEQDVFQSMVFMYTDGNDSCDCNRTLSWYRSQQIAPPDELPCGDTMTLARLTAIRPDGSECHLWP